MMKVQIKCLLEATFNLYGLHMYTLHRYEVKCRTTCFSQIESGYCSFCCCLIDIQCPFISALLYRQNWLHHPRRQIRHSGCSGNTYIPDSSTLNLQYLIIQIFASVSYCLVGSLEPHLNAHQTKQLFQVTKHFIMQLPFFSNFHNLKWSPPFLYWTQNASKCKGSFTGNKAKQFTLFTFLTLHQSYMKLLPK